MIELTNFDTSKLLKEVGFNEPTEFYSVIKYGNICENRELSRWGSVGGEEPVLFSRNSLNKNQRHLILRPDIETVSKWLREVHNIFINIYPNSDKQYQNSDPLNEWYYNIKCGSISTDGPFETYEEAMQRAIKHSITLINKK